MADDTGGYADVQRYDSSAPTSVSSSGSDRWKSAARAGGSSLMSSGRSMIDKSRSEAAQGAASYKRGGKIRKGGMKRLHSNERVIPANKRKKVERLMKREGMKLTNRKKKRSSGRR